jgi:uncharacterized protein
MATVAVPDDAAAPPTFAEPQRPHAALGPGERTVFLIGVGVIALHVADDSFLQPQPGTSAGDHIVSGLVPLAAIALAVPAYLRVRAGGRAVIALVLGFFGIVVGIEAAFYTTNVGPLG